MKASVTQVKKNDRATPNENGENEIAKESTRQRKKRENKTKITAMKSIL